MGSAQAADYSVSDPAALKTALASAAPGDRILLAPGSYGTLEISAAHFSPTLTLTALDPRSPAQFASIVLDDVRGLLMTQIRVAFGPAKAPLSQYAVNVLRSADIRLDRMEIESADDGIAGNDAYGVNIRDSARVTLNENRIHDVYRGVAILDSDDVSVLRCTVQRVGSDGVVSRGAVRLSIRDNYFSDFAIIDLKVQHPDAIQLWSRGARRANKDITISGNIIRRGRGDPSQGVFVKTPEIATRNLLIEHNIIEQSMAQGIFVENADGVVARNNTVIPSNYRTDKPGIEIRSHSASSVVNDNIAMAYRLTAGVVASANIVADYHNPWISSFIGAQIENPAAPSTPRDYAPVAFAGARDYVRDLWLGDPETKRTNLTPGRIIADLAFDGAFVVDAATDSASVSAVEDESGAVYYASQPSPNLSAALSLSINSRAALPSTVAGWRLLAAVPNSYDVRVDRDRVRFSVWTESGVTRLDGASPAILDLEAHDLDFAFDGAAGRMSISVDGAEIAHRSAPPGPIAYAPTQSLYIGGAPWGLPWSRGIERVKITR